MIGRTDFDVGRAYWVRVEASGCCNPERAPALPTWSALELSVLSEAQQRAGATDPHRRGDAASRGDAAALHIRETCQDAAMDPWRAAHGTWRSLYSSVPCLVGSWCRRCCYGSRGGAHRWLSQSGGLRTMPRQHRAGVRFDAQAYDGPGNMAARSTRALSKVLYAVL